MSFSHEPRSIPVSHTLDFAQVHGQPPLMGIKKRCRSFNTSPPNHQAKKCWVISQNLAPVQRLGHARACVPTHTHTHTHNHTIFPYSVILPHCCLLGMVERLPIGTPGDHARIYPSCSVSLPPLLLRSSFFLVVLFPRLSFVAFKSAPRRDDLVQSQTHSYPLSPGTANLLRVYLFVLTEREALTPPPFDG